MDSSTTVVPILGGRVLAAACGLALLLAPLAPTAAAQLPADPNPAFNQAPPASDAQNPEASIYSPEPVFDAGEVMQGEVVPHTFKVGNRGEQAIEIRAVNPTCGCTVAFVTLEDGTKIDPKKLPAGQPIHSLKPGETLGVAIEFNSAGQPAHAMEKIVQVISADDKQPALRLSLKCVVVQPLQMEPNLLQFGDVVKGDPKTLSAVGTLNRVDDFEIVGFEHKPDYVDVKTEKIEGPGGKRQVRFEVKLLDNAPLGFLNTTLVALTDHPKLPRVSLPISAHVKSQVVFDCGSPYAPDRLDFKVVTFGEPATRSIDVQNKNPAVPYVPTSAVLESTHKDFFEIAIVELEPGVHYRIDVKTKPELEAKYFRGNLRIRAEHPDMPEHVVTLMGWVKK